MTRELLGVTDAGEHQHLRRVDGTGGKKHLSVGMHGAGLASLLIDQSNDAGSFDEQTRNKRPGFDAKVFAPEGRPQISDRGAAPPPVSYRYLYNTKAFLLRAIVVIGCGVARLFAGLQISLDQRVRIVRVLRREWSRAAAKFVCSPFPAFLPFEIGKHMHKRPGRKPTRSPSLVVAAMAAHIE